MAHTLINTGGDHWRFLRNTLLPTFSSGKMRMVSVTCHKTLPVVQLQTGNVVNPLALENLRKNISIHSKSDVTKKQQQSTFTDDQNQRCYHLFYENAFISNVTLQMEPLFKAKYEQLLANLKERSKTGEPVEFKE